MKRQYITPSVFCVKLDTRKAFLENAVSNVRVSNEEIDPGEDNVNAGWAREDNNTDNNRGSVWDNVW